MKLEINDYPREKNTTVPSTIAFVLITLGTVIDGFTLFVIIWALVEVFGNAVEGSEWLLVLGVWMLPFWIWIPIVGFIMLVIGIGIKIYLKASKNQ